MDRNNPDKLVVKDEYVALLAEGVDRNYVAEVEIPAIEVALLAEGVDRNVEVEDSAEEVQGRPPRGGRG